MSSNPLLLVVLAVLLLLVAQSSATCLPYVLSISHSSHACAWLHQGGGGGYGLKASNVVDACAIYAFINLEGALPDGMELLRVVNRLLIRRLPHPPHPVLKRALNR